MSTSNITGSNVNEIGISDEDFDFQLSVIAFVKAWMGRRHVIPLDNDLKPICGPIRSELDLNNALANFGPFFSVALKQMGRVSGDDPGTITIDGAVYRIYGDEGADIGDVSAKLQDVNAPHVRTLLKKWIAARAEIEASVAEVAKSEKAPKAEAPDMLSEALAYARDGFHVFPVWGVTKTGTCACKQSGCKHIGKHPVGSYKGRTMAPHGLKDATTDDATIRGWWAVYPGANIGIATGPSKLLVVDIDAKAGKDGRHAWNALKGEHGELDETLNQVTGSGGTHLIFDRENFHGHIKCSDDAGLDVRADGGYIVAAPSLSGTGKRYVMNGSTIAAAPEWLCQWAANRRSSGRKGEGGGAEKDGGTRPHTASSEKELRDACAHIKADSYGDWYQSGFAFKRLGWPDEAAFGLWHDIAKRSDGYRDERDCRAKWEQLDGSDTPENPITIASIFDKARAAGWKGYTPEHQDYEAAAKKENATVVDKLNAEYALLRDNVSILAVKTGRVLSVEKFVTLTKNQFASDEEGNVSAASKTWLQSKRRREHEGLAFSPGEPLITKSNHFNLFKGFSIPSEKGPVDMFVKLILHNVNYNKKHAHTLTCIMAHSLQKPEIKLRISPFVMSKTEGVGKSLLAESYGSLHRPHFVVIETEALKSDFNSFLEGKTWVLVNESTHDEKHKVANILKNAITCERLLVNKKNEPQYEIDNYANYWFTGNRTDGLVIRDNDRRYFAVRACEERLGGDFYKSFCRWFDGEGKKAVMHYLLNYDISDFDPYADAPATEFKHELMSDNRTELQQVIADLAEDCDGRPLRKLEELLPDPTARDRKRQERFLARELRTAGAPERQIRVSVTTGLSGTIKIKTQKIRLWAVHDYKRWEKSGEPYWREQWEKQ